jgi:hypothetical protein
MNTRPTEFRTVSDFRLQRDLDRMREARNQRIAEREENYRRLPMTEPIQPEPVNFCAEPGAAPQPITRNQLIATGVIWLACMLGALWLCTAAGMAFLDAIWSVR